MKYFLTKEILEKIESWNKMILKTDLNQNFRIQLEFAIGRNGNDMLAFDSVVSHFTMLHVLKEDAFNISYDTNEAVPIMPPLYRIQWRDSYFFKCGWINEVPDRLSFWVKRTEKMMLNAVDAGRVGVASGEFKNYCEPTMYSPQKHFTIWGQGNIDLIKEVLPNPLHVGKNHGAGWGECHYVIEPQRAGRSFALMYNGYLQRPLPVEFCQERNWIPEEEQIVIRPICPPYFGERVRMVECYEGGLKLKDKGRS